MLDIDIISHDLKIFRIGIIQATKKEQDDVNYDYLITKRDKDFFFSIECFSYNREKKSFIIDPKEAYLHPNDDEYDYDDEEIDEEEDENYTEKTQSDFQGTIVCKDERSSIKIQEPEQNQKNLASNFNKMVIFLFY